jgi:hypothetical protein
MDDGKSPRVETWGEESSPDSRPKGLSSPLGRPASAVVFLQTIIAFHAVYFFCPTAGKIDFTPRTPFYMNSGR